MDALILNSLKKLITVAKGTEPPDLVLKGGRIVNVFSGEIIEADIAIGDGLIAGIGRYDGPEIYDVHGGIICPGFIDGHFHLESTMLLPQELAKTVIPHGTTAIIADPHEIANVMGGNGIRFLLDNSEGLPVDIYFMLPSCVPATHLETSGFRLEADDLLVFKNEPRVLGLAEVMNYPGVINGEDEVLEKIAAFSGYAIDGHAPLLSGKPLSAYVAAGIRSDHECTELEEAREKLRLGMHIMIREGTLAKNMRTLLHLVTPLTAQHFSLVTDDLHPSDLLDYGHLDHVLDQALDAGMDPIPALMMVTCNTARYFGLKGRGAIAPGYQADMVIVSSLKPMQVRSVIKNGRMVFDDGELLFDLNRVNFQGDFNTMNVRPWEAEALEIPWEGSDIRVIDLIPGQLLTGEIIIETAPCQGLLEADVERDILKIIVMERHHGTGNIGRGMVRGFGLQRGAIASSVAHDSHNIVCVGVNNRDMYAAIKTVEALNGGMIVVAEGEVQASLPLPIGGLMSTASLPVVARSWKELKQAVKNLGCPLKEPFMTLSFLALPVIPELKITDRGLVNVKQFQHVPLFVGGH